MAPRIITSEAASRSAHGSHNVENYLECIFALIEGKGYARPIDIAAALDVRQSSVTKMMQRLDDLGYARYEKHRGLALTPAGEKLARALQQRHRCVSEFLRLIGVEEKLLRKDSEGIEHHISAGTMKRLDAVVKFLKSHPSAMAALRKG